MTKTTYFVPKDQVVLDPCFLTATDLKRQNTYKERHKDDMLSKSFLYKVYDTLRPTIISFVVCLLLLTVVIKNGFIPSESMEPTLNVGDGIVVNRLAYLNDNPTRGDVIVFTSDEYDGNDLIKRVIGLPGDKIDIKNHRVYVNGCMLLEDYAVGDTDPSLNKVTHFEVPEDSVFLLGDNRQSSADSRWWGNPYISYDDIVGKAVLQYSLIPSHGLFAKSVDSISPNFVSEEYASLK